MLGQLENRLRHVCGSRCWRLLDQLRVDVAFRLLGERWLFLGEFGLFNLFIATHLERDQESTLLLLRLRWWHRRRRNVHHRGYVLDHRVRENGTVLRHTALLPLFASLPLLG